MDKLIPQDKLPELINRLKNEGKKIVSTNGCFDILHVGHVRYLEKTKTFGDVLIVALNSDKSVKMLKGESRPINNEQDRAEVLLGLRSVDYVVLFDEISPKYLFKIIKPDVYTKGGDYNVDNLPEAEVIKNVGGRIEFIEFVQGKSTTATINKMKQV